MLYIPLNYRTLIENSCAKRAFDDTMRGSWFAWRNAALSLEAQSLPTPESSAPIAPSAPAALPTRPRLMSRNSLFRDMFEVVLLVATIYTMVNLATARAVVEGQSMQPNFDTGQLVIVNRMAYFFATPSRGDVIVLHNPAKHDEDFIKRVVGLPGEYIQIKEGRVYANGTLLEEPYIAEFCKIGCDGAWPIGPNQYFVLGDNRAHSHDSHVFGPIDRALIVGQAWLRYWPFDVFRFIEHQNYAPIRKDFIPPSPTPSPTPGPTFTPGPRLPVNPYDPLGI